jgi:hypothetical protein
MCAGKSKARWISPCSELNTANVTAISSRPANPCYITAECSSLDVPLDHAALLCLDNISNNTCGIHSIIITAAVVLLHPKWADFH